MFRDGSHSFQLECILPDISVCKICESILKIKIEEFGKVTNDAAFHHHLREGINDEVQESDKESKADEDGSDEELQAESGEEVDERLINNLLQQI